jgi:hypothetical protein
MSAEPISEPINYLPTLYFLQLHHTPLPSFFAYVSSLFTHYNPFFHNILQHFSGASFQVIFFFQAPLSLVLEILPPSPPPASRSVTQVKLIVCSHSMETKGCGIKGI